MSLLSVDWIDKVICISGGSGGMGVEIAKV